MLRLRMCEADREAYGGPEWLTYDSEKLNDTPCDQLADIEARTGLVLYRAADDPATANSMRLWLWLALRDAAVDVDWDTFLPRTLKVNVRGGDADPPASASPSTPPSTSPSQTSSTS